MRIVRFLLLCIFVTICNTAYAHKKAVVVVPVADLVGQQCKTSYDDFPLIASKSNGTCPRIHQLIFNEVVEVVEECGDEVRIKMVYPHLFYITALNKVPQNEYWMLKKNLKLFDELEYHRIDCTTTIPLPISITSPMHYSYPVATLTSSWFDPKTKLTFSAGTRFIAAANEQDKVKVKLLDPRRMKLITTLIPRAICFQSTTFSRKQQIHLFVQLLKQWAQESDGSIPYVWGGCSFINRTRGDGNQTAATPSIKTGFDCSGLVARAAQIYDIPYFFKNSYTVATYLASIKPGEKAETGDLIWVPGHLMVISSRTANTIIEARSYDHGYGKVHEVTIDKIFKDIGTIDDLITTYYEKRPLRRIDINGQIMDTYPEFKILKLASCWH